MNEELTESQREVLETFEADSGIEVLDDGRVRLELRVPVTVASKEHTELVFDKLKTKHLQDPRTDYESVPGLLALAARLAKVSPAVIGETEMDDFPRIQAVLAYFFLVGLPAGKTR